MTDNRSDENKNNTDNKSDLNENNSIVRGEYMQQTQGGQKIQTEEEYLASKRYQLGTTIGEGSYAKVKSAYSEDMKKRVAIKIINRRSAPKDFKEKFLPRELKCMKHIDHPHCIKLHDIIEWEQKVR